MDQYFQILDNLNGDSSSNGGESNVLGWSFAPAAATADSGLHSTITVTFRSAPAIFQFEGPSRRVHYPEHVIDKCFYGLTPLSGSGQHTTVESVPSLCTN